MRNQNDCCYSDIITKFILYLKITRDIHSNVTWEVYLNIYISRHMIVLIYGKKYVVILLKMAQCENHTVLKNTQENFPYWNLFRNYLKKIH